LCFYVDVIVFCVYTFDIRNIEDFNNVVDCFGIWVPRISSVCNSSPKNYALHALDEWHTCPSKWRAIGKLLLVVIDFTNHKNYIF